MGLKKQQVLLFTKVSYQSFWKVDIVHETPKFRSLAFINYDVHIDISSKAGYRTEHCLIRFAVVLARAC